MQRCAAIERESACVCVCAREREREVLFKREIIDSRAVVCCFVALDQVRISFESKLSPNRKRGFSMQGGFEEQRTHDPRGGLKTSPTGVRSAAVIMVEQSIGSLFIGVVFRDFSFMGCPSQKSSPLYQQASANTVLSIFLEGGGVLAHPDTPLELPPAPPTAIREQKKVDRGQKNELLCS